MTRRSPAAHLRPAYHQVPELTILLPVPSSSGESPGQIQNVKESDQARRVWSSATSVLGPIRAPSSARRRDYSASAVGRTWDVFTGFSTQASMAQASFDYSASKDNHDFVYRKVVEQIEVDLAVIDHHRRNRPSSSRIAGLNIASEVYVSRLRSNCGTPASAVNRHQRAGCGKTRSQRQNQLSLRAVSTKKSPFTSFFWPWGGSTSRP